jgi:hypothetical protein
VVNVACHPTVLPGANQLVSSDFPHGLRRALEGELGGIVLYVNGAQGDVVPTEGGDFATARALGERFAAAAVQALASAREVAGPLAVQERSLTIPLAPARLPPGGRALLMGLAPVVRALARRGAWRPLARRLAARGQGQVATVLAGLAMFGEQAPSLPRPRLVVRTRVTGLRFGDAVQGLAAPGEVLTRLALPLVQEVRAPYRLFLGLTNDTLGYFLPSDEWMSGRNQNYEESVSLGPEAGPKLSEALRTLLAAR